MLLKSYHSHITVKTWNLALFYTDIVHFLQRSEGAGSAVEKCTSFGVFFGLLPIICNG
jgi:hypothetical protein